MCFHGTLWNGMDLGLEKEGFEQNVRSSWFRVSLSQGRIGKRMCEGSPWTGECRDKDDSKWRDGYEILGCWGIWFEYYGVIRSRDVVRSCRLLK